MDLETCDAKRLWMGCILLLLCAPHVLLQKSNHVREYPKALHQQVVEHLSRRRGTVNLEDGTWSSWSSWGDCSRTCGTGVSTQTRECKPPQRKKSSSNAERGCVGRYKRFQLCNTQECPYGGTDIRREQCSFFNRTPFNKRFYTWEPYIDSPESCTLNCRAVGLSFYATLNQSVIDGTPCGSSIHGQRPHKICAGGKCLPVGCDSILGSSRTVDQCGICGGDSSACRLISSAFARTKLPAGYNIITTLPPEAQNVSVYHIAPSSNYIALREKGGGYILNGPAGMNSSGSSRISGHLLSYETASSSQGDRIFARGPLTIPIDVLLFYRGPNPGLRLEYRLPNSKGASKNLGASTRSSSNPLNPFVHGGPALRKLAPGVVNDAISVSAYAGRKLRKQLRQRNKLKTQKHHRKQQHHDKRRRKRYMWLSKGYTQCSSLCGQGKQTTRIFCVKRRRKEIEAPVQMCSGLVKPPMESVKCNLRACEPEWEPSEWTSCSVTCGIGYQTRTMECRRQITVNSSITLASSSCQQATTLETAQICKKMECNGPPIWETGEWSKCSAECGLGTRRRTIVCLSMDGPIEGAHCKDKRPLDEELCDMGSCVSDTWLFSDWKGQCDGPCGEGVLRRTIFCSGNGLTGQPGASSCPLESKPNPTQMCVPKDTAHCGGIWFSGPWNECDAVSCGKEGQQRRTVVCMTWFRRKYKVAKDDSYCKSAGTKPGDTMTCDVPCTAKWFTSDWSQCSVSCGQGFQRREVKCLNGSGQPSLECNSDQKPDSRQNCNPSSCKQELQGDSQDMEQRIISDSPKPITKMSRERVQDVRKPSKDSCMDRMKNCRLVFKARLCKLKYYNKLCCKTCKKQ